MSLAANVVLIVGLAFIMLGVIGVLRPAGLLHPPARHGQMRHPGRGAGAGSLAIHEGMTLYSLKILLISVCIGLANPTATHALGRAAYKTGLVPWGSGEERS